MNTIHSTKKPFREQAGYVLFSLAFLAFGAITGGNIYQIVAEVPNWSTDIPNSLIAYRAFFKVSHAGYFFQTLVPVTILSLSIAMILLWNRPRPANRWMLISLGGIIAAEAFTGAYFLSRNFILFLDPIEGMAAGELAGVAREWQNANYIRMVMIIATMICLLKAHKTISVGAAKE